MISALISFIFLLFWNCFNFLFTDCISRYGLILLYFSLSIKSYPRFFHRIKENTGLQFGFYKTHTYTYTNSTCNGRWPGDLAGCIIVLDMFSKFSDNTPNAIIRWSHFSGDQEMREVTMLNDRNKIQMLEYNLEWCAISLWILFTF